MERKDLPLIGPSAAGSTRTAETPSPITLKGDPARAEVKPARQSEPTSRVTIPTVEAENDDAVLAQLRKIEEVVRESKKIKAERDEARAKAARLEHDLAQAREHLESMKESADHVEELQEKLEAAIQAKAAAVMEANTLKSKAAELDGLLKAALGAAASSEIQLKKQENALANAKAARDEAQHKLDSATAVLQGRPVPPKPERKS